MCPWRDDWPASGVWRALLPTWTLLPRQHGLLPAWMLLPAEEEEAKCLPLSHSLRGAEPFLLPTYCSRVLETPDNIYPMTHKALAEQMVWMKGNSTAEATILKGSILNLRPHQHAGCETTTLSTLPTSQHLSSILTPLHTTMPKSGQPCQWHRKETRAAEHKVQLFCT